jgi:two-component system sensor histidine kinase AlgZ
MKPIELVAPAPVIVSPISLWKLIAAGALFSPAAAMLAYRDLGSLLSWKGHLDFLLASVGGGALATTLCTAAIKAPLDGIFATRHRTAALISLGLVGAVGLLLAALFLELTLYWAGAPAAVTGDTLLFLTILGFWNSFLLLYWDTTQRRAKLLATQARIQNLESQIRPHFLFNTLSTVSAFIPERPEAAQALLEKLGKLVRNALATPQSTYVPLGEELELTREYLEIEQARFGDRLRFRLPDPSSAAGLEIVRLTLQPLVENAVRHGVARLPAGGTVAVELATAPESYELRVTNPVEEIRDVVPGKMLREGHSLWIVAERLRLAYQGRARFSVETADDVRFTLHIPRGEDRCAR